MLDFAQKGLSECSCFDRHLARHPNNGSQRRCRENSREENVDRHHVVHFCCTVDDIEPDDTAGREETGHADEERYHRKEILTLLKGIHDF
ncbi:hypothetical protein JTE90_021103 [Oedothorax gibbosus]|uniref:Uncharacterized protein n=1 Tax=Oedothorax gibbosus TaxID=931172 RepID=A0AAV6TIL7_9ARAC|nr:hypothetical protein JTE90_021103 [Oedothorax gibbosus]